MSRIFSRTSEESPLFRPADIVLTIALIAAGLVMSFFLAFGQDDGSRVTVTVDRKPYGTYSLDEDRQVTVQQGGHTNTFEITGGRVRMISADCRGHDCVHEGSISKSGESIICLPNRVVLEITGGEEEFDVIAE